MQSRYKKLFNDTIFFQGLLFTLIHIWALSLALANADSGGGSSRSLSLSCVPKHSLNFCQKCQHTKQCKKPYSCCPKSRLCIKRNCHDCKSSEQAKCKPSCKDHMDQKRCNCRNPNFPFKWGGKTCQQDNSRSKRISSAVGRTLRHFDTIEDDSKQNKEYRKSSSQEQRDSSKTSESKIERKEKQNIEKSEAQKETSYGGSKEDNRSNEEEIEHYDGEQNEGYDTQKVGRKNKSSIKQRQSKLISEQEESYQSSEPTTGENLEDSKSQHTSKSVDDELIDEIEASPERSSDEYGSRDTKDANQSVDEIKISSGSRETKDIMQKNEGKITAHLEGNGDKDEGRSNSRSEYDDDNGEYKGLENEETDTSNAEYVDNYKYDNLLNVRSRNHKNEIPSSEELGEDNNKKSTTAGMDEKSQDDTENVKYDSEESSDSGSYEESDHKQRSLSPEIPIDHQGFRFVAVEETENNRNKIRPKMMRANATSKRDMKVKLKYLCLKSDYVHIAARYCKYKRGGKYYCKRQWRCTKVDNGSNCEGSVHHVCEFTKMDEETGKETKATINILIEKKKKTRKIAKSDKTSSIKEKVSQRSLGIDKREDLSEKYSYKDESDKVKSILENEWCSVIENPTNSTCDKFCNGFVIALNSCNKKIHLKKSYLKGFTEYCCCECGFDDDSSIEEKLQYELKNSHEEDNMEDSNIKSNLGNEKPKMISIKERQIM